MYVDSIKGLFNGTNGVTGSFDFRKFIANEPDLVTTNGMAFKYMPAMGELRLNKNADVFEVKPGELAFNFIGG